MTNQDRSVAYHGQQILLVFSSVTLILSLLFYPFGFLCAISVGVLGIWQIGEFTIFWLRNGWRKWYIWYIGLVLIGVLLILLSYTFSNLFFYFITPIYFLSLSFICWNLWHK